MGPHSSLLSPLLCKRKSTEVVIEEVDFCESKSQNSRKESEPMAPVGFAALPDDDGGLPF